jgi:hypothetical protein
MTIIIITHKPNQNQYETKQQDHPYSRPPPPNLVFRSARIVNLMAQQIPDPFGCVHHHWHNLFGGYFGKGQQS